MMNTNIRANETLNGSGWPEARVRMRERKTNEAPRGKPKVTTCAYILQSNKQTVRDRHRCTYTFVTGVRMRYKWRGC